MKIAVAMSGGVDSSVTAALLKQQGHEVTGITMRLFAPRSSGSGSAVHDAAVVAGHIGIPHHVADFSADFSRLIIGDFIEEYRAGHTPNPCVRCNRYIKFGLLLDTARELGAELLATGHYVRKTVDTDGTCHLKTAENIKKQASAKRHLGAHQQRPRTYKQTALNHQSRAKRPLDGTQTAVEGRLNQNQTGSQQPKVIGQQPAASSQQPAAASKQLASSCNTKQLANRKQADSSNHTATNREGPAASSRSTQVSSQQLAAETLRGTAASVPWRRRRGRHVAAALPPRPLREGHSATATPRQPRGGGQVAASTRRRPHRGGDRAPATPRRHTVAATRRQPPCGSHMAAAMPRPPHCGDATWWLSCGG